MARHRTHGVAFKRQVAQEFLAGEMLRGMPPAEATAMDVDPVTGIRLRSRWPRPEAYGRIIRLLADDGWPI